MKKYFKDIKTIEELKKEYKRLARELHPDLGGSTEEFQKMFAEYEACLKEGFINSTDKEISEEMWKIINRFMFSEDIVIEVVGEWLWISGETFAYKDQLKELNAKWSKKHKKWYYTDSETRKRGSKEKFEDIAKKYGYKKLEGKKTNILL